MKISIAKSELLEALNVVSRGMSSRSTLPILSGIYLSAADGLLSLQATDLEVSVRHKRPCLAEDGGETVVPGKLLGDIVRTLPDAAVTLETDADVVSVRCQHASFTLKTLNPADFPKFPEIAPHETVSLPSSVVNSMVRKVARAVSRDETRAILTGVRLIIEGPCVRMVATDSYRLATCEVVLTDTPAGDVDVVIPGRALEEAMKIASSTPNVTLSVSENQIVFELEDTTFVTRRIEGAFPNYKQLLPSEHETSVTVATEEFLAAVKRVSLMALHNTPLRMTVSAEDQTLSMSATTQDVGDASEDLMVKVEGRDVEIAFNHAFLADGLNAATSETIRLEIQNALKPGILKTDGEEDFVYLLMPVRLG